MDSMFQKMMELPLFHGVSFQNLSEVLGKHRFHFLKYADGATVVNTGDPCTHLLTVISGSVQSSIASADNRVTVTQILDAPDIIAPEFFFGKTTRYPSTIVAQGTCGVMLIEKKDYITIINSDEVLLFNFLNLLSRSAQWATEGVLALTQGDLKKRIAYWIVALTNSSGRDITMECRHRDLYSVFGVPRQSLIATLEQMKDDGIIDYTPSAIRVSDRRKLVGLLSSGPVIG